MNSIIVRNSLVNDENGDLFAYSRNVLNRWNKFLNVHDLNDARQKCI